MTKQTKSNLKYILLISLFCLLVFCLALFSLKNQSLQTETNQLLNKAELIKEQTENLPSKDKEIQFLPKNTDNPATRAIKSGAKYYRVLSQTKIILTIPYNQEGQIKNYVVLSAGRRDLSFQVFLISSISATFYLAFLGVFTLFSFRRKHYRENLLSKINKIKENPLGQSYFLYQRNDEIDSALNQLAEELKKKLQTQDEKKETLYQFSEFFQFPIFICDSSGKIHYSNNEFQKIFSSSSNIETFNPYPEFLNYLLEHLLLQQNESRSFYFESIHRYYSVEFFPLSNLAIKRRFLFTMTDITSYQQALESERELLANISHELKTPLSSIRGFADLLAADNELSKDEERHFLQLIQKESHRLIDFVAEVLFLSHSVKKVSKTDLQVKEIVLDVLKSYQKKSDEKKLSITLDLEDCVFLTNKEKFYTICKNLIENAVNYTPIGGKIRLQLHKKKEGLRFSIRNSGRALTALEKLHLFDRFYRSESAVQSNPSGSGLGLAIVQKNVQDLDGRIEVTSKSGEGTNFTVFL